MLLVAIDTLQCHITQIVNLMRTILFELSVVPLKNLASIRNGNRGNWLVHYPQGPNSGHGLRFTF